MMHRHVGPGPITPGDIPEEERPAAVQPNGVWRDASFERCIRTALAMGVGLKEIGRIAEETAVSIAVSEHAGNLQRAALSLRVTDRALQLRRALGRREREQNGDSHDGQSANGHAV